MKGNGLRSSLRVWAAVSLVFFGLTAAVGPAEAATAIEDPAVLSPDAEAAASSAALILALVTARDSYVSADAYADARSRLARKQAAALAGYTQELVVLIDDAVAGKRALLASASCARSPGGTARSRTSRASRRTSRPPIRAAASAPR